MVSNEVLNVGSDDLFNREIGLYNRLFERGKEVYNIIADYLRNNRHNGILVLDLFPACGKTFTTARIMQDLKSRENPFIYYTSNYSIVKDFISFYRYDLIKDDENKKEVIGLRGKANSEEGEFVCKDDKGRAIVQKYGTNSWYCKKDETKSQKHIQDGTRCPLFSGCEYKEKINLALGNQSPGCWAGHFMHYTTFFQKIYKKKWKDNYHIIQIFDEDMSEAFTVNEKLNYGQLMEYITNTTGPYQEFFKEIVDYYDEVIVLKKPRSYSEDQALWDEYNDSVDVITKKFQKNLLKIVAKFKENEFESLQKAYDKKIKKKYHTPNRLDNKNPFMWLEEFQFYLKNSRIQPVISWLSSNKISASQVEIIITFKHLIREQNNMIILNATLNEPIFEKFLLPNTNLFIKHINGEFGEKQKVYRQIAHNPFDELDSTYPMSSLINKKEGIPRQKLYDLLEKAYVFSRRHENTVVFIRKAVKDVLEDDSEFPNKMIEWEEKWFHVSDHESRMVIESFSEGRGKNDYEDFDGCVILHTPYLPPKVEKLYMEQNQCDKETVFKNYVQDSIYQSINRIRPLKVDHSGEKECEILIFPATKIPDLKFKDGVKPEYFKIKEFYMKFDPMYLDDRMKKIIKIIHTNPNINRTNLYRKTRISHASFDSSLKLCINNGFVVPTLTDKMKVVFNIKRGLEELTLFEI